MEKIGKINQKGIKLEFKNVYAVKSTTETGDKIDDSRNLQYYVYNMEGTLLNFLRILLFYIAACVAVVNPE